MLINQVKNISGIVFLFSLTWSLLLVFPNGGLMVETRSGPPPLNIDIQAIDRFARKAMAGKAGTLMVGNPQTGEIYSVIHPSIAFSQASPPGSVIKPFTAVAALRRRAINEETEFRCSRVFQCEGFRVRCAHEPGINRFRLVEAIAQSCNSYFGRVARQIGAEALIKTLKEFGAGEVTGVNLRGERRGFISTRQNACAAAELGVGESGSIQVTPVQLMVMYGALINGGRVMIPKMSQGQSSGVEDGPRVRREVLMAIPKDERDRIFALVRQGLIENVRHGTGRAAQVEGLQVIGKTGTATVVGSRTRTQAWFVGFAGKPRGEIEVLVYLQDGIGGEDAAPIAHEFLAQYRDWLSRK